MEIWDNIFDFINIPLYQLSTWFPFICILHICTVFLSNPCSQYNLWYILSILLYVVWFIYLKQPHSFCYPVIFHIALINTNLCFLIQFFKCLLFYRYNDNCLSYTSQYTSFWQYLNAKNSFYFVILYYFPFNNFLLNKAYFIFNAVALNLMFILQTAQSSSSWLVNRRKEGMSI